MQEAEILASSLPLHDTLSPLGQLRAYLRHFLHPQATMGDAARLVISNLHEGPFNAQFPHSLWDPACQWVRTHLPSLPTSPITAPLLSESPALGSPPAWLGEIAHICLPFAQEGWLRKALGEAFPHASFSVASPSIQGCRAIPDAFWLQPLLLGNGAMPSQGQSSVFGGKEIWENAWDLFAQPADLMAASLLHFPSERFERGKSRLTDILDEGIAHSIAPLSAWIAPPYREHATRLLYWMLGQVKEDGQLLLILPPWLAKDELFDGVRAYIDSKSLFINLLPYEENAVICWIKLGKQTLPPKRLLLPRTVLQQDWIAPLPPHCIKLGEKMERRSEKDAPLRLFQKSFEIRPWQSDDCTILQEASWQLSPLGIEAPALRMPEGIAWPSLFFGEKLDQPNTVLFLGKEPGALWAFQKPFLPDALGPGGGWAFPLYVYEKGKRKENLSVPALRAVKKWAEAQYPAKDEADPASLAQLLEEAAKLSRLMPVLQKYVQRLHEMSAQPLASAQFGPFLEEASRFRAKIQQLMPGAYERKATFDRLLQGLSGIESLLQKSLHDKEEALLRQGISTAEGIFAYLYQQRQHFDFQDWHRMPLLYLENKPWEAYLKGQAMLSAMQEETSPAFSLDWEELMKMPFSKWQELEAPANLLWMGGKPLLRLAWEALRKMGKYEWRHADPGMLWARALHRHEALQKAGLPESSSAIER